MPDIQPRSMAAVAELERLQARESSRSGLVRKPADDPRVLREIAQRQLMAERLDRESFASQDEITAALVHLVGEPSYEGDVDARAQALAQYFLASDGDIWSRYERPDHRRRLANLVVKVEAAAAALGHTIPRRPVIGTLQTGDINAQSHPGPAGEGHLVIFESGTFVFSSVLAEIAVQAVDARFEHDGASLVFLGPGAIVDHVARHPGVLAQFADLTFSQGVLGTCLFAVAVPVSSEYRPVSEALTDAIETFVLAHEYGHVLLGHTDLPRLREDPARAHEMELEADRVGLELAAAAIGARHWAFLGAGLFVTGVEMVSRAASTFRTGRDEVPASPTHPSPRERGARLAALLPAGGDPLMAPHMIRLIASMAWALERLWVFTRRAFETAHASGYPPAGYRPRDENEKRAALEAFMTAGLDQPGPAS